MESPRAGGNLDSNQDGLHQQYEELRQAIRDYEESIKAIEKGEKHKNLSSGGNSVDNLHAKIVGTEDKLRSLEKEKLDKTDNKEKPNKKEKKSELADKIKEVKGIPELLDLLRNSEGIKGSKKFFTGEELVQIIQDVLDGNLAPNEITNSEGLRAKVRELVRASKKAEKPKKESGNKGEKEEKEDDDPIEKVLENNETTPSLAEQFASAKSITEIIEILEGVDSITTLVGTEVSGKDLIDLIRKVETGDMPIAGITNAEGLRDKVKELLNPKVESQESEPTLAEKIKEVKGIPELLELLKNVDVIHGVASDFTGEDLIKIINAIVNDGLPRSALTNAEGLRDKLEELLGPEPEKIEDDSESLEEDFEGEDGENDKEDLDEDEMEEGEEFEEELEQETIRDPKLSPKLPTPEQLENIENARLSLEEAREIFVKEHQEYLKNRKKQNAISWIKAKLGIQKKEEEQELPESLQRAKSEYDNAKIEYAKVIAETLRERNFTEAEVKTQVYERVILDENGLLRQQNAESWTPKEKGCLRKSLDWYMRQNGFVKIAISTSMLTVPAAAIGLVGVPTAAILFAGTYAGIATSVGIGHLVGLGFEKIFKDKSVEKLEAKINESRSGFVGSNNEDLDIAALHELEEQLREVQNESESSRRKRLLAKSAVMIVATMATGYGLRQLMPLIMAASLAPDNIPGNLPDNVPDNVPDNTPPVTPEEVIPKALPVSPFEFDSTSVVLDGKADNLWTAIKVKLESQGILDHLPTDGQRIEMVDRAYNVFEKMSPTQLKEIGISSGDISRIANGRSIDLSAVFGNPDTVQKMFEGSSGLKITDIVNIEDQHRVIDAFQATHPKVTLVPSLIRRIVAEAKL